MSETMNPRTSAVARHLIGIACFINLLAAGLAGAEAPQSLDKDSTTLADTRDNVVGLSSFKGKPTVVFYEDRYSTEQNRKVKDELWKRGKEAGLLHAANVIGVANLSAYDFWPARGFAKRHVEGVEKRVGIPVLIDWKGTLNTTPWNLPTKSSTVLLFDADGKLLFSHSGTLTDAQIDELFGKLRTLIGSTTLPAGDQHG